MTQVAHVEMESKRGCACRSNVEEWWAMRRHQSGRIFTESGPHRCNRKEIGEIERMEHDAPDVSISISRQAPAPGLDRIDRLQAAGEAQILNRFHDERRGVVDPAAIH